MPVAIEFYLTQLAQLKGLASDGPATPARRPLSFSDLQQGMRTASHSSPQDRSTQMALVMMVLTVIVLGIVLHLRQRRKEAGPPSSATQLARELCRQAPIPFSARLMLGWVARTVGMPTATLLLSATAFDAAVNIWVHQPTFTPIRHWGQERLMMLKPLLFE